MITKYNIFTVIIFICIMMVLYVSDNKIQKFTGKLMGGSLDLIKDIRQKGENKIFVSIASYRDKQCLYTLKDLFINAKYPENINVGICQQNKNRGEDCMIVEKCIRDGLCIKNQIKIINLDYTEAKGPAYARYLCSTLYNNEDYYLQIDSHMNFVEEWDDKLIKMYNKLDKNNKKDKVLSTYPLDYSDRHLNKVSYICESMYKKYKNIPEFNAHIQEKWDEPKLTYIASAGFLFMPRNIVLDVPFDNKLDYLFMGEEVLYSMRLFTHGYSIFAPNENIMYHDYGRKDEPKVWDDNKNFNKNNEGVINKVKYLFEMGDFKNIPLELQMDIDKYSAGKVKTVQEYLEFADLDMINGNGSKKWCE